MKKRVLALLVSVGLGALLAAQWAILPTTIESKMVRETAGLVAAARVGDRDRLRKLTLNEEVEGTAGHENETVAFEGEFEVPGVSKSPRQLSTLETREQPLEDLLQIARRPVSYSSITNPYAPTMTLNFKCSEAQVRCLEHAIFFFSERAEKVGSYYLLWNQPVYQRLWSDHYSRGTRTIPCNEECPYSD